MAAFIVLGAVVGKAQTSTPGPCEDAAGQAAAGDNITALFKDKTLAGKKTYVEAGKTFLVKYGSCESAKETADYFKTNLPKFEDSIRKIEADKLKADLILRFNKGLETKNWEDVYSAGKEILGKYPDEFRDVELALGSIGYDESFKKNFKYNDDTLKYAQMSISELESGKTFSANFGIPKDFVYKSKDNALGWMNLIIGYITSVAQKNKPASLPYLFKATQSTSTTADSTAKNPIPYELIGTYYFEELDKLTTEIKAMAADQKDADTPEIAKQKVDAIKAKVALSNGMAERAMDAFSRAYTFAKTTPEAKLYKDSMKKNVDAAYNLRFAKKEGVDAWIVATLKKPLINPTTPVTPISDTEPVAPTTTTTTTTPPVKPGPSATKPPAPPPTKPAVAPTATKTKPQAKVKKPVAKKKTT